MISIRNSKFRVFIWSSISIFCFICVMAFRYCKNQQLISWNSLTIPEQMIQPTPIIISLEARILCLFIFILGLISIFLVIIEIFLLKKK